MIKIYLSDIRCKEETDEVGADEPYVLVTAVNLASSAIAPAFEVVRYGPFPDVDEDETHFARGISQSFWSLTNTSALLDDPENVIFIVALMENDEGDPEGQRGIVKGLVGASLLASLTFNYNDKVNKLINDVNAALGIPAPDGLNFDDKVGDPKPLRFSAAELIQAESAQEVRKTLEFTGDGGTYQLNFVARNPLTAGDLIWHRHTAWQSGSTSWANGTGNRVGSGWQNFKSVLATTNGAIYAIQPNGDLLWYYHNGWLTSANHWAAGSGKKVGNGWAGFKSVFAERDGLIYAIQPNGDLLWYKHNGWQTGAVNWANSGKGKKIGNGWAGFKSVFATTAGVIYAIQENGDLLWYKHDGYPTGTMNWTNSGAGKKVGNGWAGFKSVFAVGDGVIYAVQPNGDLLWYKHNGWQTGTTNWANAGVGTVVGNGWQNFKSVFARYPEVIYGINS